jgi:nitroreductase
LQAIPGLEPAAEPDTLITALLKRGRWLDALELAVRHLPERSGEVMEAAGEEPWTRGMQAQLYSLLAALPEPFKQRGLVLIWRLIAALALGKERDVLPEVEAVLAGEDASDLRALYAEARYRLGDLEAALGEAERAAGAQETAITLYTYGRALALRDPEEGLSLLERGLRLAEANGEPHHAVQIAQALASRSSTLGRYRAAANWAQWGLRLYGQRGMDQVIARLQLLNAGAYARILLGETADLEEGLRLELHHLEGVYPSLSKQYTSTLADLLLSTGKSDEALRLYRNLWLQVEHRRTLGAYANLYVRALLEVGAGKEALEVARHAEDLSRGLGNISRRRALLALGMALCESEPARAAGVLEDALGRLREPLLAPELAQAGLYLARAKLLLGDQSAAWRALGAAEAGIRELGGTGLRYLAGPREAFEGAFRLLEGKQGALELRFLGGVEARLEGKRVDLSPRLAELLTVLALHPEGLSGEALTLAVYGEYGDPRVCKAELGRLRKKVPLKSRPYRLGVETRADLLELIEELSQGEGADLANEFTAGQLYPRRASVLFIMTARFFRNHWKYRKNPKTYGVILMDAAHLSQSLYLVAADLGLGAFVTAAINSVNIESRLGLDGCRESPIAICGAGIPADDRFDPEFHPYTPRATIL